MGPAGKPGKPGSKTRVRVHFSYSSFRHRPMSRPPLDKVRLVKKCTLTPVSLTPVSAETLAQLAALPAGAPDALRIYLHGDYLLQYTAVEASDTVYLLSIRHHPQLSFDFAGLWNRG